MKISKRRRTEGKTDYKARMDLLKSEKPRIVFRKTNRYIISQYVISDEAQDKIILQANSKELLKYGWPEKFKSVKNTSASYLTGFLLGKKMQKEKLDTPIIDFGMLRVLHKTKLFAFIKGLNDAGVETKCDAKNFPEEEKIFGKKLKNKIPFKEIKDKLEKIN